MVGPVASRLSRGRGRRGLCLRAPHLTNPLRDEVFGMAHTPGVLIGSRDWHEPGQLAA